MTILAQHGWGKKQMIEQGISDGSIQGVIMSPRDESPENLASFLSELAGAEPNTERLVDPQLYAGTIWPVRDGRLTRYDHYRQHLTPASFSPEEIRRFVTATLDWQQRLDVTAVMSPTVMVDDLTSQWAQVALMLAQETLTQHDGSKPLLVSIVVGEDALRHRVPVDDWLDDITHLDADGFYLIVRRGPGAYRQHYDPDVLAALLRVSYALAELNEYRLFIGYTDMATLLLHAVGVTGTAAGWYTGLRQFTLRRFEPTSGGRRPRARYSSRPLLNSIYMTELDGIYAGGLVRDVLSNTFLDAQFSGLINPENVPWPDDDAALHHWAVLEGISQSVLGNTVSHRLDAARNQIARARAAYAQIGNLVPFTTETGPTHLDQWLDALNRFRSDSAV